MRPQEFWGHLGVLSVRFLVESLLVASEQPMPSWWHGDTEPTAAHRVSAGLGRQPLDPGGGHLVSGTEVGTSSSTDRPATGPFLRPHVRS